MNYKDLKEKQLRYEAFNRGITIGMVIGGMITLIGIVLGKLVGVLL